MELSGNIFRSGREAAEKKENDKEEMRMKMKKMDGIVLCGSNGFECIAGICR